MGSNRRQFLKAAAAGTVLAAANNVSSAAPAPGAGIPTIKLGDHQVTRLVAGSNPQYGYSHFNRLYDQHMREYHTPERVVEFLRSVGAGGINTWQAGYNDRMGPDYVKFQDTGGRLQLIVLTSPDFVEQPEKLKEAARYKPIAMVQHGWATERMFRAGEFQKSRDFLKRIRDTGALVGLSTHDPRILEKVEGEGWDVDLFMVCMYYVIRPRQEIRALLGDVPLGECFIESDRERSCATIRQSKKPCLLFKIFGAGRTSDNAEQRRASIEYAFGNIKPGDAVIVGMYNRFSEQVAENAAAVRQVFAGS